MSGTKRFHLTEKERHVAELLSLVTYIYISRITILLPHSTKAKQLGTIIMAMIQPCISLLLLRLLFASILTWCGSFTGLSLAALIGSEHSCEQKAIAMHRKKARGAPHSAFHSVCIFLLIESSGSSAR